MVALLLVTTLIAAVLDQRSGRIPNWLSAGVLVIGVSVSAWSAYVANGTSGAATSVGMSALGAVGAGLVPLVLYRLRAIGAGDVKLFIAIGAALQLKRGLEVELAAFVVGAVLAQVKLAWEGTLLRNLFEGSKLMFAVVARTNVSAVAAKEMAWFRLGPAVFLGVAYVALTSGIV